MKHIKEFESSQKYQVGDNVVIMIKSKDKYNAKIVQFNDFERLYPYVVMLIPNHETTLPKTFDKYGNTLYYVRPLHIIEKIEDKILSDKIDSEYNKIRYESDLKYNTKKYNL